MPLTPFQGAAVLGAGQALAGFASNAFFGKRQHEYNMELARYQTEANERYQREQNEYNSPKNQMSRFQEAGLNPNLIYGQGNPGNQSAPTKTADYGKVDFQRMAINPVEMFSNARLMQSQVQAIDANVVKTQAQSALAGLQAQVLAKNPLLNSAGYNAIIEGLKATAESKSATAAMDTQRKHFNVDMKGVANANAIGSGETGIQKMALELQLLEQKFKLGTQDAAIKAEVLNSKEFQNAILEVQKRFMTEADITPQHIMQFIQLLLMKML